MRIFYGISLGLESTTIAKLHNALHRPLRESLSAGLARMFEHLILEVDTTDGRLFLLER